MSRQRLTPDVRKEQILDSAVQLAEIHGYQKITRDQVATHAGCATGLVTKYFSTMPKLRRAVMSAAIARRNLRIIAEGLAARDAKANCAPQELRLAAAHFIIGE